MFWGEGLSAGFELVVGNGSDEGIQADVAFLLSRLGVGRCIGVRFRALVGGQLCLEAGLPLSELLPHLLRRVGTRFGGSVNVDCQAGSGPKTLMMSTFGGRLGSGGKVSRVGHFVEFLSSLSNDCTFGIAVDFLTMDGSAFFD